MYEPSSATTSKNIYTNQESEGEDLDDPYHNDNCEQKPMALTDDLDVDEALLFDRMGLDVSAFLKFPLLEANKIASLEIVFDDLELARIRETRRDLEIKATIPKNPMGQSEMLICKIKETMILEKRVKGLTR